MEVAIYSIAKNEEESAHQWSETGVNADYQIVGDTGSTDNTIKILQDNGVVVFPIRISPWRFDDALNATLALIPDVDVCIRLDMDETLSEDWRYHLEKAWKQGFTKLSYPYVWSWKGDKPGLIYDRDHIHTRHGYRWVGATHEGLTRRHNLPEEFRYNSEIVVHHHPKEKNQPNDLVMLLETVAERPNDPRSLFYLAREYFFQKDWPMCVATFERYLALPGKRLERAYAYRLMSLCYGESPLSVKYIWDSINEIPTRESYLHLAKCIPQIGQWAVEQANECPRHQHWTEDPDVW
jgi:hypothetical protein